MTTTALLLYVLACVSVTVLPGPTTLLALSNGTSPQRGVVTAGILGAALSDLVLIAAVAAGLGTLLKASEALFQVVKWAGVAYLAWLAVQLWRSAPSALRVDAPASPGAPRGALARAFRRSFLVALSNPKGLLFFSAFLPQFIDPASPQAPQYAALGITTAVIDAVVMAVYAAGGARAVRFLTAAAMRRLNRGCAALLGSFAALLAVFNRAHT